MPNFNAGYVAFPERHSETGARFGRLWLETAAAFDFGAKIGGKRPWLDQITLPLTLYRYGFAYEVLEDLFNFDIMHQFGKNMLAITIDYAKSRFIYPPCNPHFKPALGVELRRRGRAPTNCPEAAS